MKRPKKRYATEQDILDKIEAEHQRNRDYLKLAEHLEAEVVTLRPHPEMAELIFDHLREIGRSNRICNSIIENRLPKLKNKLSEFRTPQFAALDNGDPSIPVA